MPAAFPKPKLCFTFGVLFVVIGIGIGIGTLMIVKSK